MPREIDGTANCEKQRRHETTYNGQERQPRREEFGGVNSRVRERGKCGKGEMGCLTTQSLMSTGFPAFLRKLFPSGSRTSSVAEVRECGCTYSILIEVTILCNVESFIMTGV